MVIIHEHHNCNGASNISTKSQGSKTRKASRTNVTDCRDQVICVHVLQFSAVRLLGHCVVLYREPRFSFRPVA